MGLSDLWEPPSPVYHGWSHPSSLRMFVSVPEFEKAVAPHHDWGFPGALLFCYPAAYTSHQRDSPADSFANSPQPFKKTFSKLLGTESYIFLENSDSEESLLISVLKEVFLRFPHGNIPTPAPLCLDFQCWEIHCSQQDQNCIADEKAAVLAGSLLKAFPYTYLSSFCTGIFLWIHCLLSF